MRTGHPVGPTHRPNDLEARIIINEIPNVQHHPFSGGSVGVPEDRVRSIDHQTRIIVPDWMD